MSTLFVLCPAKRNGAEAPARLPRGGSRFLLAIVGMVLLVLLALGAPALRLTAAAAEPPLTTGRIAAAADPDVTWTYVEDLSGDATITGYALKDGVTQINIPETIDGHRVGGVANEVFKGNTQITKVTFPSSVVSLGENAFENCTSLTYVDLTAVEELGVIPTSCFQGCTALEAVDIPASVGTIGNDAFADCTSLKQANIPPASKLDHIGINAFLNCESLESLELPASLQWIGLYAFSNCKSVASLRFRGSDISIISLHAFDGCAALEEVCLPDHVGAIGDKAFANCTSLKVVVYGKALPQVQKSDVFEGCSALELMIFPTHDAGVDPSESDMKYAGWTKGMAYMTYFVTQGGDAIAINRIVPSSKHRAVTVPAKIGYRSVTRIADFAALDKTLLTEVRFPSDTKINHIGSEAFKGCTALKKIEFPASVKELCSSAFKGCTSLSSVSFNTTSLSTIESEAFSGCTSLTEVTLPEGVTTIGHHAFYNCLKLETVNLSDSLQNIDAQAFSCDHGKHMAIKAMRMPNSSGAFKPPSDSDFFERWIVNQARDTFKFKVTYGSTADYSWFEPHILGDPQFYPIALPASDREYVPVAIGDEATHTKEANDVKLNWSAVENWTGEQAIPEVTATRWLRTDPVGGEDGNLTVEPLLGYDCTSVGTQKVVVTGNAPYFTGYRIIEYEIVKSNMDGVQMMDISPACVWDNRNWEPDPGFYARLGAYDFLQDVPDNSGHIYNLIKDRDYTIAGYEHNKMASDKATITIEGKGNFQGKKTFTFTIKPADLDKTQVKVPDQVYTGQAVTPVPSEVMLLDRGGKEYTVPLDLGVDYKVDSDGYENNTDVGAATMTLTPVKDCAWLTGSKEASFKIVQADISQATVEAVSDQTFTGADIAPALKVSVGEAQLVQGRDYTVTWQDNRNVGTAHGTVTGIGPGCMGTCPVEFRITPKLATITVESASKAQGEPDPIFTGTAEGLVDVGDLGEVRYVRTNDDEAQGTYRGVLDAVYAANPNYDVSVVKGDFTIKNPNYSVCFDANVPASASTACSGTMEDQSFAYDETKALSTNGYFLPGYEFTGWNSKADGTGTPYADKEEVQGLTKDGGAVTLYAQWWGKPYTIEYWSDDAGSQKHIQTAYFDRPVRLYPYSDSDFGWDSGGMTLHGWFGTGFGSFYEDGEEYCNLCGAPDADGNVANSVITAEWVYNGQIVVTVTKDGAPQEDLKDCFTLVQDGATFSVPIEYKHGIYVFDPSYASAPGTGPGQLPQGDYMLQFASPGYPKAAAYINYGKENAATAVFDFCTVSLTKDPAYADFNDVELSGGEPVAGAPNTVIARDGGYLNIKTTVAEGYRFDGYTAVGVKPVWDPDPSAAKQMICVQDKADIFAHVSPKPRLTITALPQPFTYNGQTQGEGDTVYEDPAEIAEKVKVEGLREGDVLVSVVLNGQGKDVGSYDLTAGNAAVTRGSSRVEDDYAIVYVPGALTIGAAKATITVNSASKVQGTADPAFTGSVEGLVAEGDLGEVRYVRTNSDEAPGTYRGVLDAVYVANKNYDVAVAKGDFAIKGIPTVRWLDGDGTLLQEKTYVEGQKPPAYDGKTPVKHATVKYSYKFAGWDGGIVEGSVTTYRPLFAETVNKYTVKFVNYDGTVLQSAEVAYGQMPTYTGKTPKRAASALRAYTFKGWAPAVKKVTKPTTYKATYASKARKYAALLAKIKARGNRGLAISWNEVAGADGYDVMLSRCNHDGKVLYPKKVATVKAGSTLSWKKAGFRAGTAYKARVRAYVIVGTKKVYVKTSSLVHAYTSGSTRYCTNAKGVSVNRTSISLAKGRTFQLKARVVKLDKRKELMSEAHAATLRYLSTNASVASVNGEGKIRGVGRGACYVYAYAHNGVYKKVKVSVR